MIHEQKRWILLCKMYGGKKRCRTIMYYNVLRLTINYYMIKVKELINKSIHFPTTMSSKEQI